jgi:hypothetical protein
VNAHSVHPGFDPLQGQRLPSLDRFPKLALLLAGAAAHHRSCHVAPVAGLSVARKNIENDQAIGAKRAEPAFVWIAGLIAAGHDRVRRYTPGTQNCAVYFRAQNFRSQRLARPLQFFPRSRL